MGTDYNGGGFTQNDDGAVFGDPSGAGSVADYDSWDWKQIEAAINGMSAGTSDSENADHAAAVSSPQSLQDAADAFYHVQNVLAGVAKAITDQTNALTGENGPWKGDAADAFHDMMMTFAKQVTATANVLAGGDADGNTSGTGHSVPQQLADNAVNLANAQQKIHDIDVWYAHQASLMGVTPMSNGLIPVSKKPEIVKMLNRDMRAVLKNLAGHYQVTIDSVRPPGPITSPTGGDQPGVDDPPPTDTPPDTLSPTDITPAPVAPLANTDLTGTPTLTPTPFGTAADFDPSGSGSPSPYTGSLDSNGPGSGPGSGDTDGLGGLDSPSDLNALGNPNDTLDPTALDSMLNPGADGSPTGFGGGTGLDGTGTLGDGPGSPDSAFSGDPGGSGGPGALRNAVVSPYGDTGLDGPGTVGGDGGFDGLGGDYGPGGGVTPAAFAPSAFGGGTGLNGSGTLPDSDLVEDPSAWTGQTNPAAYPGGSGLNGSGVSDLAGYDPAAFPGTSDLAGYDPAAVGGGAGLHGFDPAANGFGLESDLPRTGAAPFPGTTETGATGTTGGGMPFLPPMTNAGTTTPTGERSDASGLLDPTTEPWNGTTDLDGTGLPTTGTPHPHADTSLDLPTTTTTPYPGTTDTNGETGTTGTAGGGMPFLPPMTNAGTTTPTGERSDASGLLDPTTEPWTSPEGDDDAVAGVPVAGAAGLSGLPGPVAERSEPVGEVQPAASEEEFTQPAAPASAVQTPGTAGMPYLPMSPGGAPGGSGRSEDDEHGGLVERGDEEFGGAPSQAEVAGEALAAGINLAPASSPAAPAPGEAVPATEEVAAAPEGGAEAAAEPGDPLVVLRPSDDDLSEVDVAAWGLAGASFVPLLLARGQRDEESEIDAPDYATADDGTWGPHAPATGGESGAEGADGAEGDAPSLVTWRPQRAAATSAGSAAVFTSAGPGCAAAGDEEAEEEESGWDEEPETARAEGAAEEPPSRGIADLLVQEGDATWGAPAGDTTGQVI
ncbi:hypothetical protein SAMN05216251_10683 [Actinacidiphila alni]|uniref:WXG100 family type VII secretion target n=1 Tax=Actinacidiphila alni TaxID=380248 RepID=A0A1I2E9N1_9ACTN|nr:WXG100 family type VII secretion target [Actinacidiphila alni]SFE89201.1 hypothetical protein SAMN05216251_10683 [Actinacidiphila alni]